jgi:hypothetical protein
LLAILIPPVFVVQCYLTINDAAQSIYPRDY